MRAVWVALISVLWVTSALAQQASPVPQRRVVLIQDSDLPGTDITTLFDTTEAICRRTCLGDQACVAYTFNSRANSCFPKSAVGGPVAYAGAISGRMFLTSPEVLARAPVRAAELGFVQPYDFEAALAQAGGLADLHPGAGLGAADDGAAAGDAAARGDLYGAVDLAGAAVAATDAAADWVSYAQALADAAAAHPNDGYDLSNRAVAAAVNGYLRADAATTRAAALVALARAFEPLGRGADMIPALRLAQQLAPAAETAAALADAVGTYGFRVLETQVQSDLARPRICAVFSEDLLAGGFDYAPFVQTDAVGLSVDAAGGQLCLGGVSHGARYAVTLRAGLPAASGERLAAPVTLTLYVRDRAPGVRFPGRAYVLPRTGEAAIPVDTVNTATVALSLREVPERNILRAVQAGFFGRPLAGYELDGFGDELGAVVWSGTADVAGGDPAASLNRDVTTRLPMAAAIAGRPPGIYALQAAVPGTDRYDIAPATQWFVVSDLGLTTMLGTDGLHVFVRGLGDAAARADVTATLLSTDNGILGTAVTDAGGYARFAAGLTRGTGGAAPALLTVADGAADFAFLSLTEPEFDLSDRGVAGREPAPPVDVFLTTDRGAYRAGETIRATMLARDGRGAAIAGLPLTVRLMRPDGMEYTRLLAADAGAGGHLVALPVGPAAPRGPWRLDVFADPDAPALASRTVLVEDFLPERIDVDLSLPDAPVGPGDAPVVGISVRYLFGAVAAGLPVEGEVLLRPASGLAGYPGYRFGPHDSGFSARYAALPGGVRTDAAGNAAVVAALPQVEDPGVPLDLTVTVRVAEGSGRPVERSVTRALTPAAPLIGIKPLFADTVPEGTEARFDVVAVGAALTPVALPVRWTLDRIETEYQWYQQYGNWNWEPMTTRTRVAEGTAMLSASGAVPVAAAVGWGEYELVVERSDGVFAAASTRFFVGWYAPADASATPDTLAMSLDKQQYRVGETAVLRLTPRAAGTALVSVISDRLIDRRVVKVAAGETLVPLPVTADWGAGAYVTVSVLRPMDVAAGRNPARALGVAHAAVDPGQRQLVARLDAPAETAPRGPLQVALRVDGVMAGETAYATIAAVDLGILNLTGFESPDPSAHFFGQRRLGMAIRDIYGRLIDGLNGAMGTVRSGGDTGAPRLQAPPPTEDLVAFFAGPLTVGPDGTVRTAFDLPAFNGTVRLMAVVWSPTGVGQASADVLVRDPVVVSASLPRFMAPGDDSRLLLEITHATGPAGRVGLDVTAAGVSLAVMPNGVDLAVGGRVTVAIPLTAAAPGIARLRVAITTPDGRQLVKDLQLPVQANDPETVRVSRFDLAPGDTFTFDDEVFTGLRPGGTATLAVGPVAQLNAPGLLATLARYPYGCSEQIAAGAMPLLYLSAVAQTLDPEAALTVATRVDQAIAGVLANQSANGAFGLWEPGSGDFWLDAFVTDFLSRARAQGFAVPDLAFRSAMDNLRNQVNTAPDFDSGGGDLAYALMVLAREGAAAVGDLRYYADVKGDAFDTAIGAAQLGAALAAYGDPARADAMFARAGRIAAAQTGRPEDRLWRADYGTDLRDAAAVLALATDAGSTAVDTAGLTAAVAAGATGPVSTQEATWALLAAHALIDRPGAEGFTVDGAPAAGPLVRLRQDAAQQPVAIRNGTAAGAVLTLTTFGVPDVPDPAGGQGYAITRRYYDMAGAPANPAVVQAGTRLVTVLEVSPLAFAEARLMVEDPLPAGFEIDNPNLMRGGDLAAFDWLDPNAEVQNAEFRQDRFLAAVDWTSDAPFRLAYVVRAVSPGRFRHPAASVRDMYRPAYRAQTDAGEVTIAP